MAKAVIEQSSFVRSQRAICFPAAAIYGSGNCIKWHRAFFCRKQTGLRFPIIVGNPFRAVFHINNPALPKTEFLNGSLHGKVVFVGVDSQIVDLFRAVGKASLGNSFHTSTGSKAVNGSVQPAIMPCTVFYVLIVGFGTDDEGKSTHDCPLVNNHIAVSAADVRLQVFQTWIAVCPIGLRCPGQS